jgi:flagellar FliL protein
MPEERPAKTPPTDDAAIPASAPSAGGFQSWLPLIITIVLMPVLAWGVTKFVLLPQLQKSLGITSTAGAAVGGGSSAVRDPKAKLVTVPVNKLLVNVAGSMGARYLLVSLSVVGTGDDFKAKLDEHDAQLRDMACGVLAAKSMTDLEKPGERNVIRNELISGFNNILGDSTVQEIYIPEFAIQ